MRLLLPAIALLCAAPVQAQGWEKTFGGNKEDQGLAVIQTADRGYLVTLVEDACGTTHEDLHQVTMRNFQRLFGRVRSTEQVLGELTAPVAA